MNAPTKIDMLTAARLTREGRLEEAMAVIRKSLSIGPSPDAPSAPEAGAGQNRAGMPSLSIAGALGGLAQRIGSLRPAQGFGLDKEIGSFEGFGQKLHKHLDELLQPVTGRAPVATPDGARFEQRSFCNAAGVRAYKLFVPSGYSGQALPLVVMLHGCTQSPDDFALGTRMNDLAEEQTFLVAYPEQSRSANAGKCWNWFNADDQRRDRGEPSLIAGITREIMQEFSVDPGRVYIAGLSAGGAAAAIMGSVYPDLYAAIGVHSGLPHGAARDMPSGFAAMRNGGSSQSRQKSGGVPAIVFHGDGDTTVHPSNGHGVISQSKAGADHALTVSSGVSQGGVKYTCTVHADESGRPMAEHWILHGTGHAWSGGSSAGSFTDPRGPDASREMMRFFGQHRNG
jgi:poly(hydroxyalkanoate) depolymerase family esterase